jgi:hypothetical protein
MSFDLSLDVVLGTAPLLAILLAAAPVPAILPADALAIVPTDTTPGTLAILPGVSGSFEPDAYGPVSSKKRKVESSILTVSATSSADDQQPA